MGKWTFGFENQSIESQKGEHIYTNATLAKINFRWRTALVI